MTVANLFIGSSAAYLMADQAGCHDDGTILDIRPKVTVCERLSVAVSVSGRSHTLADFAIEGWLGEQRCQKSMLNGLPDLVRWLESDMLADHDGGADEQCGPIPLFVQLHVAMWSHKRSQPETYVIASPGGTFPAPYQPYTVAGVRESVMPAVDRGLYPRGEFYPERHALPLILAQRLVADDRGIHRVGGALELVTVNASGVTREVLQRWDDKIGEMIEPGRVRAPTKGAGWLSRLRRRGKPLRRAAAAASGVN